MTETATSASTATATDAVAVFWNIKSGWSAGEQQAAEVQEILRGLDSGLQFRQVQKGEKISDLVSDAVAHGKNTVVAAGGDGTINAVASALVHSEGTLAVIPAGTLNHFARDLGIKIDPVAAARQLVDGRRITVDVGEVNGRIFINNSVLGFYPIYSASRRALETHSFGDTMFGRFFSVIGGLLRVFWRLPHLRLRLVTSSQVKEIESPFVLVANNEHELEKGRIGQRASMNAGHLWVYVMRKSSRWQLMKHLLRYVVGRFSKRSAFDEYKVRELRIERRHKKRLGVGIDGEVVSMQAPLVYRSLPASLHVLVPQDCPIES